MTTWPAPETLGALYIEKKLLLPIIVLYQVFISCCTPMAPLPDQSRVAAKIRFLSIAAPHSRTA